MRSTDTITLFSDQTNTGQKSSSFIVSIILHVGVIALVIYGVLYGPHLKHRVVLERIAVRHLDLQMPDLQTRRSDSSGVNYPGPKKATHASQPAGKPAAEQAPLREVTPAPKGLQTLMQPKKLDVPIDTPIPTVVLAAPEPKPVTKITPPKPAPPTTAEAKPVLQRPNLEKQMADIPMPATPLPTPKLPLMPSTTTPVVVHVPDAPQQAPQTSSTSNAEPTPTTVVSLSDLQMKQGTVVLPPANSSAPSSSPGALKQGEGQAQNPFTVFPRSAEGRGGTSNGAGAGDSKDKANSAGNSNGGNGAGTRGAPGSSNGSALGTEPPTQRIVLPKTGVFGSVVAGSSLAEKYPQTEAMWRGRLAYTVYLHVGLSRSWIMQYSLPRDDDAAEAGSVLQLKAPWPFNIVRPTNGAGEMDADALMVHGFVNTEGRFEGLNILVPPDYEGAKLMLESLQQWEFRPAVQNGQKIKVEVLLIIPEEVQ
ncbi:MAG: hypothetical protein ABSF28_18185 [Terracidiphilus sp.]|jgi:hypothetical protein